MSRYEIHYHVVNGRFYEGTSMEIVETLLDVVQWLDANKEIYDYSLDNIQIVGLTGDVDAYGLVERANSGRALSSPGFLDVQVEVIGLLRDVDCQVVGQATLDRVELLRNLVAGLIPTHGLGNP